MYYNYFASNPVNWCDPEVRIRVRTIADEYPDAVGIRIQYEPFEMGPIDHISHRWVDEQDTGEELPGISTLDPDFLYLADMYPGKHVAILGGNLVEYGYDPGEAILTNAEVIDILC